MKLALIACALLPLLAAPIAAHAAQGTAAASAEGSPPPSPAPVEQPPATGEGETTPPQTGGETPPPVKTAEAEEPAGAGDVESEDEEALTAEDEVRLYAEEMNLLRRVEGEAGEEEGLGKGSGADAGAPCLVPSLKGDTLKAARRALSRAHCKLGRVTEPHSRRTTLVVTTQALRAGDRLADHAPVSIKLGKRERRHRRA